MYHWIEDKEFESKMRSLCADIINQLVQRINNDGCLRVEAHLVGSGAKNMITQNANEPVDLDYNLCIRENHAFDANDGKCIQISQVGVKVVVYLEIPSGMLVEQDLPRRCI